MSLLSRLNGIGLSATLALSTLTLGCQKDDLYSKYQKDKVNSKQESENKRDSAEKEVLAVLDNLVSSSKKGDFPSFWRNYSSSAKNNLMRDMGSHYEFQGEWTNWVYENMEITKINYVLPGKETPDFAGYRDFENMLFVNVSLLRDIALIEERCKYDSSNFIFTQENGKWLYKTQRLGDMGECVSIPKKEIKILRPELPKD